MPQKTPFAPKRGKGHWKKLQNGNKLSCEDFTEAPESFSGSGKKEYRIYHSDNSFAAVYEYDPEQSILSPVKMF